MLCLNTYYPYLCGWKATENVLGFFFCSGAGLFLVHLYTVDVALELGFCKGVLLGCQHWAGVRFSLIPHSLSKIHIKTKAKGLPWWRSG